MNEFLTTSTSNFLYFLIAGSVIVYLILKFDTSNRKKLNKALQQAQNVQPLYMKKEAKHKLEALKEACSEKDKTTYAIEKQLDELVADYDKGSITLPDYCNKLSRLLSMTV